MASGYTALPSTGQFHQQAPILLPSEVSKEKIEDGQDALARGLKLDGINRPVLAALCAQRSIPLRIGALKKEMIAALNEWVKSLILVLSTNNL
jgi:predicted ATPase